MTPKMSQHQLLQDLQQDNSFFDQLVDMIPAKLYVAGHSGDGFNPKYFKGQAKESKEARRAKSKQAKRAKLDPSLAETTTQTKKRLEGERSVMPTAPMAATQPAAAAATTTPPETSTTTASTDNDNEDAEMNDGANNSNNKSRIEALREKLHAKLAEKRGQRPTDPNVVSKRAARRAEKKKRQEDAAKRKKKNHTHAETDTKSKTFGLAKGDAVVDAATDLAQLDFGRLSGLNPVSNDHYQKTNKSLANMSKTRNLQKMLADAEEKRQRMEELKVSTTDEDKKKAANMLWGDAIKEATGERVKDDPAKLKKAIKHQAAKKAKSSKAWKTRLEQTREKMGDRQKIRNHNLNQRKLGGSAGSNLSSKKIATEDKGDKKEPRKRLSRAGFEGKKQDFLNKKGQ
jgi:hypothetical protein